MDGKNEMLKKQISIDIAVLCQEFTAIDTTCNNYHVVNLDKIDITEENFKNIFYPHGENFGINKLFSKNEKVLEYVSFRYPHRKKNETPFFLLEELYKNLEDDLGVPRNCFTTCSSIELANQITKIDSLYDINDCTLLTSIQWSNILKILNESGLGLEGEGRQSVNPIFVISVVFKTPTEGVKPTIVKFNYNITI